MRDYKHKIALLALAFVATFQIFPGWAETSVEKKSNPVVASPNSAILLKKLKAVLPGTNQIALMNLFNDETIQVQLLTPDQQLLADLKMVNDGEGQLGFYTPKQTLLADLSIRLLDKQWRGEGHLMPLSFRTLSNRTIQFEKITMMSSQFGSVETIHGILQDEDHPLKINWSVVLGRSEHSATTLLFDPYDQSEGSDQRYFILKKTPFGVTELNYKFNRRQLFIDRHLGAVPEYTVILEYVPETVDEKIKKDVAKLKVHKQGARLDLTLQSYPELPEGEHPEAYREIHLSYDEVQKKFDKAEDRTFVLERDEYHEKDSQPLDLGGEGSLADVIANIVNNQHKILGEQGMSVPTEVVDLVSLLDLAYQDGLLKDSFMKHIAEFLINDATDPIQPELMAAAIDMVLFDRGPLPVMDQLNTMSTLFSTELFVYARTARIRFENDLALLNEQREKKVQENESSSSEVADPLPQKTPKLSAEQPSQKAPPTIQSLPKEEAPPSSQITQQAVKEPSTPEKAVVSVVKKSPEPQVKPASVAVVQPVAIPTEKSVTEKIPAVAPSVKIAEKPASLQSSSPPAPVTKAVRKKELVIKPRDEFSVDTIPDRYRSTQIEFDHDDTTFQAFRVIPVD